MSKPESRISSAARRLGITALAAAAGTAVAFGQATLAPNSPFAPSAGPGSSAGPAQGEAYELSGSSVQGSDVAVCIYERQSKHSQWIPVGGVFDGIHVISFDAAHDKAMINVGGAIKELSLRKATFASASPAAARVAPPMMAPPPPAPAAPPTQMASSPPAPPANAIEEQREARMLVSDLLEIGVQQRRAYQEARQKAASETPAQPSN